MNGSPSFAAIMLVNNLTPYTLMPASPVGCSPGSFLQQPQPIGPQQPGVWIGVGDQGVAGVIMAEFFTADVEPVTIVEFNFNDVPGSSNAASCFNNSPAIVVTQSAAPETGAVWSVSFTFTVPSNNTASASN
jgi:hypothetical protein